jgi:hypothetical protein
MLSRGTSETEAWRTSGSADAPSPERDARFRAFREGAFVSTFLRQAPMERFWLSDLRRFSLFLYLMRESGWMLGGEAGRFPFALVAMRSQLSLARVSQLLEMACATGDFLRHRDPRDARQYVFEPSDKAIELFEHLVEDFHAEAPALLGRRPPPTVREACGRRAQRRFIDGMLHVLGDLDLGDRGVGSLSFMLAMLDLHLHSPLATSDLIRREAARLHVTCVTIRNLLRRAEERDWLSRDRRMLSLGEQGRHRIALGMEAFESLAEAVLEAPARASVADRARAAFGRHGPAAGGGWPLQGR